MDDQGQVHHDKRKDEGTSHRIANINEEDINAVESAKEAVAKIKGILTRKVEDGHVSLRGLAKENISEVSVAGLSREHTLEETLGLSEEKEGKKVAL